MKILARKLNRDTTEANLRSLFEDHGTVQACDLVIDKETETSKGFAFIEMEDETEAEAAILALNSTELDGEIIRVKASEKTTPTPKKVLSPDDQQRKETAESVWGKKK
ncbi:MAG: RNA-binding protein [Arenicellales bacterium]